MRKATILLCVLSILVLMLVVTLASAKSNANVEFRKCTASCNREMRNESKSCDLNFVVEHKQCIVDKNVCLKNAKNTTNSTLKIMSMKSCEVNYINCSKSVVLEKKECKEGIKKTCDNGCSIENLSFCTEIYMPVCGVNNKTYSNQCELKNANVTKSHDGSCIVDSCRYYYWFDNNHKGCNYKKYCGEFMYFGLRTFENKTDCMNKSNESVDCNTLNKEILGEIKNVQSCVNDSDCVKVNLNAPCAFFMCGSAMVNQNASLDNLNSLFETYIPNCQKVCPMIHGMCRDSENMRAVCDKGICNLSYLPVLPVEKTG